MRVELFRDCIGRVNERWLARQLGFTRTGSTDEIDLLQGTHGIEVKTRRMDAETLKITVHNHQYLDFRQRYDTLHWAFVYYRLAVNGLTVPAGCPNRRQRLNAVREAVPDNCSDRTLESFVIERRVIVKPWEWITKYPVARTKTGNYRYVRETHLAPTTNIISTTKGPIYLPPDFP